MRSGGFSMLLKSSPGQHVFWLASWTDSIRFRSRSAAQPLFFFEAPARTANDVRAPLGGRMSTGRNRSPSRIVGVRVRACLAQAGHHWGKRRRPDAPGGGRVAASTTQYNAVHSRSLKFLCTKMLTLYSAAGNLELPLKKVVGKR